MNVEIIVKDISRQLVPQNRTTRNESLDLILGKNLPLMV